MRSSAFSFYSYGYNMHQAAQNIPKVPFVLWSSARTKVVQLADPNSLRLVLIGWSLSRRTNQGFARNASSKGSLVYVTASA